MGFGLSSWSNLKLKLVSNNLFNGLLLEIQSAKIISNKLLGSVWKRISDKPLPDVYAYTLADNVFRSTLESLQKHDGVTDTRVKEYGVNFDNTFIEACTFEYKVEFTTRYLWTQMNKIVLNIT